MKCLKCQADNPETRKFCRKCGNRLVFPCPSCGSENIPGDEFCGECGHSLTSQQKQPPKELSFEGKLDKIQRYLPGGLTEKILAQRGKIEGERRQVTVMFCDMEGFTRLSERLGPEEIYSLMDQVYEILIHKVHDYEGTVNEMTGDGIMALFGAPIALEDAPQRAIRSAFAIHREMTRFSDRVKQEKGLPPIKMRVGIHTGPVVVGTLGNNLRVEFKAVGETVNFASRMESLAEPGTTYVSEETFKQAEGFFRFESLGEKRVKGKEEAVKVYQVIAPSSKKTRFDVSAERGLTPFVGRERELELLLDGFERSKEGRGQAFSIVDEAGVGKSRFLYEFRKAIVNENVTFLEGKCLSYGRGMAYHPVIEILKANFDISDGEEDYRIREKVQGGLKAMASNEASTLPYLLELLSVKESGLERISMSPEARKDRTIEALKEIVLRGSALRPLILAIEDLHWLDKSSEDALPEAAKSVLQTGSVIEREFSHELMKHVIGLPEQELLSHLSALKDAELIFERGIYSKSAYIFKHALTREVVYDSILASRKKKLHEEIGKAIEGLYREHIEDYYGILAQHFIYGGNYAEGAEYSNVAGRKAEKAASLPEAIAYSSQRIDCLEKLPTTIDLQKQIIDARVTHGLYLNQLNHHVEAKETIQQIFELAKSLNYKKRLGQIYTILGAHQVMVEEKSTSAFRTLEQALNIAEEVHDRVTETIANYWLAVALAFNCEFDRAVAHFQKLIDINVAAKNLWGIAIAKSNLAGVPYLYMGYINLSIQTSEEALIIAEESGDIYSKGIVHCYHGFSFWGKGLLREAEKHLMKSIEYCEKIDNHGWNAWANLWLGEVYFELAEFQKSITYYDKGCHLFEQHRMFPSQVKWGKLGSLRSGVLNGQKDVNLESIFNFCQNNKTKLLEGWIQRYVAEILLNLVDQHMPEAEHWVQIAIESDRRNCLRFHLAKDYELYANLLKRKGDRPRALEYFGRAIDLFKECGADGWLKKAETEIANIA